MRIGYFERRQLVKRCTTSRSPPEIYRPAARTLSEVGRPRSTSTVLAVGCGHSVTEAPSSACNVYSADRAVVSPTSNGRSTPRRTSC